MVMIIPGTDGFECTGSIHDIDRNIKVIMVSSMMDDELVSKTKKLRIIGYVQNPVDSEVVKLLIKRVTADEELFKQLAGFMLMFIRNHI